MGSIGPTELILIGLVVVLIFGAGRIAEIGKGLGEGIRNFKKGIKDDPNAAQLPAHSDDDESADDDDAEEAPKARKPKSDKKVVKKTEKKDSQDDDES